MSKARERTPLHLIGGSLGSGKTTLLRRILAERPARTAVIVNEFGDIGIDGSVIEGQGIEYLELTGGCVCCSLAGEFAAGVRELIETVAPASILVETTGVAEADALIEDIKDELPEARLETVVVLADADTATRFPELGHVERNQLAMADLVVINKTDLVDEAALARLRESLVAVNPRAPLLEARYAAVDTTLLLTAGADTDRPRPEPGDHPPEHGMERFHWRPERSLNRGCVERTLATWPRAVYRAKGRLYIDGEPRLLNYVAGRWQLDPVAGGDPALVWIGPDIGRHREDIITALEACYV